MPPLSTPPRPAVCPTDQQSPSPIAQWRVTLTPRGTVDPTPPHSVKAKLAEQEILTTGILYRFKHEKTGRRYIGSTVNPKKRFTSYKSKIKRKSKLTYIENALRRSPEKFTVAIVKHLPNSGEHALHVAEENLQNLYQTRSRSFGYNQSRPTQERLRCKGRKPADPLQKTLLRTPNGSLRVKAPATKTTAKVARRALFR